MDKAREITERVIEEYGEEMRNIAGHKPGYHVRPWLPAAAARYVRDVATDFLSPDEEQAALADLKLVDWQAVADAANEYEIDWDASY